MPLPVVVAAGLAAVYWTVIRAAIVSFFRYAIAQFSFRGLLALAGVSAVADKASEWFEQSDFKASAVEQLNAAFVRLVYQETGLELDAANPFSKASISGAIGAKVGVEFTDITSRDAVLTDVSRVLSDRINQELGTEFDAFWPPQSLRENLEREIVVQVERAIAGGNTFLSDAAVSGFQSFMRQHDGVYINRTEKVDRERSAARFRYRKYMLTHKRVGGTYVSR